MFGSDFMGNFGLPAFPFQGVDAQGGLFSPNAQPGTDPNTGPVSPSGPPAPPSPAGPAALGANNPLGGGPLAPPSGIGQPAQAPDGGMMTPPPPAAGIGSPFGRPNG